MPASNNASRLRQIGPDQEIPDSALSPQNATSDAAALNILLLALKTLSQRSLVALGQISAALVMVGALGSVWWLFNAALPADPSVRQLVGLALYGGFVLTALWMRR